MILAERIILAGRTIRFFGIAPFTTHDPVVYAKCWDDLDGRVNRVQPSRRDTWLYRNLPDDSRYSSSSGQPSRLDILKAVGVSDTDGSSAQRLASLQASHRAGRTATLTEDHRPVLALRFGGPRVMALASLASGTGRPTGSRGRGTARRARIPSACSSHAAWCYRSRRRS